MSERVDFGEALLEIAVLGAGNLGETEGRHQRIEQGREGIRECAAESSLETDENDSTIQRPSRWGTSIV